MPGWLILCVALSSISWWYVAYLFRLFYRIECLMYPVPALAQWLLTAGGCYWLTSWQYHSDVGYLHIGLTLMLFALVNVIVHAGLFIMGPGGRHPVQETEAEARIGMRCGMACMAMLTLSMGLPYVAGARSEGAFMRELLSRVEQHADGDHIHVICSRVEQYHSEDMKSLVIKALNHSGVYFRFTTEDPALREQIIGCETRDDEILRLRDRVITLVLPPGTDLRPNAEGGRIIALRDVRWRS